MISKNLIILIICLSGSYVYLMGLKKCIISILVGFLGYVTAHFVFINDFLITSWFKIVKKSQTYSYFNLSRLNSDEKLIKRLKRAGSVNLKGSASSSSISQLMVGGDSFKKPKNSNYKLKNNFEICFESDFKANYPWQSIYISENIEKALEEFLSLVIQNYILIWYSKISADDGLIYEIKYLFRHVLANLILRLKQVDLNYFATFKLNTLLFNHISDFYFCFEKNKEKLLLNDFEASNLNKRIEKQHELLKLIQKETSNKNHGGHFAMNSRHHELIYLRQLCKKILPYLLPESISKCKASFELIEEILVSNIFLKGLDIIAEPDSINKLISLIIQAHFKKEKTKSLSNFKKSNVQLLKHWCQMNGCIFKTIQAPSLKEIFENNELLHLFINYMNSLNSICLLELFMSLKETTKVFQDLSIAADYEATTKQVQELKTWCETASNKQILETISYSINSNYYQQLNNLLNDCLVINEPKLIFKSLMEIQNEMFNLIKEIFYSSFIKSDYMYKHLIGLHKLNTKTNLKKNDHKKCEKDSASIESNGQLSENRSEKDFKMIHSYSNDFLNDDIETSNEIEMDDSTENNFYQSNQTIDFEKNSLDDVDDEDENEFDENNLDYQIDLNKVNHSVRLDLINEIKDEILDKEDSSPNKNPNETSLNNDDDDDEEDEDLIRNDESIINLKNLRVCIDDIEELTDKSNKTCFVFVIQVWSIDLKQVMSNSQELKNEGDSNNFPSWCVKRKYDEFYVLDTRLKEFHGGSINCDENSNSNNNNQTNVQLPSKQRAMFFISNSRNLEYLNSIKNDFAKYLQSLLANPILSMSQLIRSFLDPHSIEFSSSIFNEITNLSKMVKGVPYKLRLERGQSLDSFLMYLLQSIKEPKPKSIQESQNKIITEDIIQQKLNNKLYIDTDQTSIQSTKKIKHSSSLNNTQQYFVTPFESLMFLIKFIYKLPNSICLIIFSIRKLVQKLFDYLTYMVISKKTKELTTADSIENFIQLFKELIFENNPQEILTSQVLYENAFESINDFIYSDLVNILMKISEEKLKTGIQNGTRIFLESFQYPLWNKNLTYLLLDAIIQELFPELERTNGKQND